MKILIVLTSHDALGDSGQKTGFWLEELAAPYYALVDAGLLVTLASPKGGRPPADPLSDTETSQTDATRRFKADPKAQAALANTVPLRDVIPADFDAVFYPGGHGPLFDLAEDPVSIALIESMLGSSKPAAFVCHGPGVLRHVRNPEGEPIVTDKDVTGFSNSEERTGGRSESLPFLVETMLQENGGRYAKAPDGEPYVLTDGMLITGQNAASSEPTVKALLKRLNFFSAPSFVASIPWNAS